MRKFVDGLVFDTGEAESWEVQKADPLYFAAGKIIWRTKKGEWVLESIEGNVNTLTRLTPSTAAQAFTEAGVDLPDVLLADIEA